MSSPISGVAVRVDGEELTQMDDDCRNDGNDFRVNYRNSQVSDGDPSIISDLSHSETASGVAQSGLGLMTVDTNMSVESLTFSDFLVSNDF